MEATQEAVDPKKMTVAAKKALREMSILHTGSHISIGSAKTGNAKNVKLGNLCWDVCVRQHKRRVQGRKAARTVN